MALRGLVKTAKTQSSKPQLGSCAVSMEALLRLLLNLFAICVLNKISRAKLLSTLVALLCGPDSGSGDCAISLNGSRFANDSFRVINPLTPHINGLFGLQVLSLQILEGRSPSLCITQRWQVCYSAFVLVHRGDTTLGAAGSPGEREQMFVLCPLTGAHHPSPVPALSPGLAPSLQVWILPSVR